MRRRTLLVALAVLVAAGVVVLRSLVTRLRQTFFNIHVQSAVRGQARCKPSGYKSTLDCDRLGGLPARGPSEC